MSTLSRAIEIAITAHKGQKDKAGADYILHPLRVMEMGRTEAEKICGVLHDVVEDSDWTFEMLEKEGFSEEILSALKSVTKTSEDENYEKFIERIVKNPIAAQVKINDLIDNLDIKRFKQIEKNDLERINKYLKAYRKLKNKY